MATVIHRETAELRVSVDENRYPDPPWLHTPDLSAVAAVDRRWWKVVGDKVVEMSEAEKLPALQAEKAARILARTAELQALGFEFPPGSGQRFSLTQEASNYWVSMMVAAGAGLLQYPVNAGIMGDGTYALADASAVATFCAAALDRGRALVEGEADLKRQVYAATTIAALDAVTDGRE